MKKIMKKLVCLLLCAGLVGAAAGPVSAANYKKDKALAQALEKQDQNVLVSPMSLNLALAMTANGASGATKKELASYLGNSIKKYNQYAEKYYSQPEKELKAANSVWIAKDRNYGLSETFSDKLEKYFHAEGFQVDFKSQDTVTQLNKWVSDNTEGMIPKLVNRLAGDTSVLLANALYFDARWREEFDPDDTREKVFTNSKNQEEKVKFMNGEADTYFYNKKAEGFAKSYRNSRFAFIGILPKAEGTLDLDKFNLKSFLASESRDYDEVYISMPKLDFEYSVPSLKPVLQKLGVRKFFSPAGQLNKIASDGTNLYVDDVLQKCKIQVDEGGTKAAAATAVITKDGAAPGYEPKIKYINLDRPYVFLLYDREADSILFLGKVNTVK